LRVAHWQPFLLNGWQHICVNKKNSYPNEKLMKPILFLMLLAFAATAANAQFSKHIVRLKDKAGTPFTISNPSAYLSAKSIARRTKQNIAIDSTDLPITPRYLDSIRSVANVTILNKSKWLNQVLIQTTNAAALAKIQSFPFVQNVAPVAARLAEIGPGIKSRKFDDEQPISGGAQRTDGVSGTQLDYGNARRQIEIHNGQFLHNWGFMGQTMTVAVMDAGFSTVATNPGVDSLRINNQIKGTWDFVANEPSVTEDDAHGFYCLSIMGANKPGFMVGSSPKANYYLYRTEDVFSEYPIEEQHWAASAELADSIGADVFSTSLGYLDFDNPVFNYSYAQRNGNTAIMTLAGDLAAKKGILVCNSAGNNGAANSDVKYMAVPADGDSINAVGACDVNGNIAAFSAWGPTSSGRTKPNLVSVGVGTTIMGLSGNPSSGNGTSFSNPNMAGLLTCLWQAFYESGNMEILDAAQQAGHRFSNPDGRFGYGIPDMKKAFVILLKKRYTANASVANCITTLNFGAKGNSAMRYELERKGPGDANFNVVKTFAGSSAAFQQNNYVINDTLPYQQTGAVSYRIKHVIGTDTSFYYDVVNTSLPSLCNNNAGANNAVVILPNPVKNTLIIRIGAGLGITNAGVKITDEKGRLVYSSTQNSNLQNININAMGWAAGFYTVEVISNGKSVALKRVIKD
jgi:serine protease AprX